MAYLPVSGGMTAQGGLRRFMRLTRRAVVLLLLFAVACVCLLAVGIPRYLSSQRAAKSAAHPFTLTVLVPAGGPVVVSLWRSDHLLMQEETSVGQALLQLNLESASYRVEAARSVGTDINQQIVLYNSLFVGETDEAAELQFGPFPSGLSSVTCAVYDENEERAAQASVWFQLHTEEEVEQKAVWTSKTDSNGLVSVSGLVDGRYDYFAVLKDGEGENRSGVDKYSPESFVQVGSGSSDELLENQPIPIVIYPVSDPLSVGPYLLRARWRNDNVIDFAALADLPDKASVFAVNLADGTRYTGKTALGDYEFFGLKAGSYQISVSLPTGEYGTEFVTLGDNGAQAQRRGLRESGCEAGQPCSADCCCPSIKDVFFQLTQGGGTESIGNNEIGVSLVDSNGAPVVGSGINISVRQLGGGFQRDFVIQEASQGWLHNVPPGKYVISVSDTATAVRGALGEHKSLAAAQIVEIEPGSSKPVSKQIEIRFAPGSLHRSPRTHIKESGSATAGDER